MHGGIARAQLTGASEHKCSKCSFLSEHHAETKHAEMHLHKHKFVFVTVNHGITESAACSHSPRGFLNYTHAFHNAQTAFHR